MKTGLACLPLLDGNLATPSRYQPRSDFAREKSGP
jgi:hypothetical protein